MTVRFVILFLSMTTFSFGQITELKTFEFQNQIVQYYEVDCSKYGVAHYFISMYDDDPSYIQLEQGAYNCLSNKSRIYHTLFYFIRIPAGIEDPKLKSAIFEAFLNHENIKKNDAYQNYLNVYLNFEDNYAAQIISDLKRNNTLHVKRVKYDLSTNNICKYLGVQ